MTLPCLPPVSTFDHHGAGKLRFPGRHRCLLGDVPRNAQTDKKKTYFAAKCKAAANGKKPSKKAQVSSSSKQSNSLKRFLEKRVRAVGKSLDGTLRMSSEEVEAKVDESNCCMEEAKEVVDEEKEKIRERRACSKSLSKKWQVDYKANGCSADIEKK